MTLSEWPRALRWAERGKRGPGWAAGRLGAPGAPQCSVGNRWELWAPRGWRSGLRNFRIDVSLPLEMPAERRVSAGWWLFLKECPAGQWGSGWRRRPGWGFRAASLGLRSAAFVRSWARSPVSFKKLFKSCLFFLRNILAISATTLFRDLNARRAVVKYKEREEQRRNTCPRSGHSVFRVWLTDTVFCCPTTL